jgi:hypothetical protein
MTMRSTFGEVQDRAPVGLTTSTRLPAASAPVREIPYDHVATFTLLGKRGNRVQDVINVAIDGTFVAVSIGYSFIPAVLDLGDLRLPNGSVSSAPLRELTTDWLLAVAASSPTLVSTLTQALLVRLLGIDFKYSIVDSGTGRELQNKPIHNLAGLGEASGDRPFRPLAKPMTFMPRSSIRMEIEEINEGPPYIGAQLYIVLHGYKILGQ